MPVSLRLVVSAAKVKGSWKDWRAKRKRARVLQQVVPPENPDDGGDDTDLRATRHTSRPGFSLPLMTSNFRRFNARYGLS
jgi:hypothetical protein